MPNPPLTLIGLSGSLREASLNRMLLEAAAEVELDSAQLEVASIQGIPLYNQDVEDKSGIPPIVSQLQDRIAKADGLLLVTPEYNHSIPGVFKNAIDWITRPPSQISRIFQGLPVGVIGASPGSGGSSLAQLAWLPVLQTLKTIPFTGASLIVPRAEEAFGKTGKIIDPKVQKYLQDYLSKFVQFVKQHRRS